MLAPRTLPVGSCPMLGVNLKVIKALECGSGNPGVRIDREACRGVAARRADCEKRYRTASGIDFRNYSPA